VVECLDFSGTRIEEFEHNDMRSVTKSSQNLTYQNEYSLSVSISSLFRSLIIPLFLFLTSLACAFSSEDSLPDVSNPTPVGDVVHFRVPIYSTTLNPGDTVPATQMTYSGREGDVYNVTIDGLSAAKRVGDSFSWRGIIGPGVLAKYNLRLSPTFLTDDLLVGGPLELWILNPVPVELPVGVDQMPSAVHYSNIAVDYTVPKGGQVPGTSLVFEGETDQGAQLSGTSGFPYRVQGDSLIWAGRLRGNVNVRYSLRLTSVNEDSIRLLGTAEVWVAQN
jgi:hypothetical protein